MPFFEHDRLKFRYFESGSGIPFVFQHGLGGSLEQTVSIFSPPPGIRFISFDFRGHGDTLLGSEENLTFETFADDIVAMLKHLQVEAAIIGGISMGAGAALNFALRYPNKTLGLVLSRPAWLDEPMEAENRKIFKLVSMLLQLDGTKIGRGKFMASDTYLRLSKKFPNAARSFLKYFQYERAVETSMKFERLPADAPSVDRKEWSRIQVPTLILASRLDPVHPFEYGLEYSRRILQADLNTIAAKALDEKQHMQDVQYHVGNFLEKYFAF